MIGKGSLEKFQAYSLECAFFVENEKNLKFSILSVFGVLGGYLYPIEVKNALVASLEV